MNKRLLTYLLISIFFQLIVISISFYNGKLSGLLPWDDCVFLSRGIGNSQKILRASALWQVIPALWKSGFHAPVGDLQVLLGLIIFNGYAWGPYLLNFLTVLAGMIVVDRFFRNEPDVVRISSAVFFLLVPFIFINFDILKADYKGGVFIFIALLLLFDKESGCFSSGYKAMGLVVCFLSLAALSKITAFYLPLIFPLILAAAAATQLTADRGIVWGGQGNFLKIGDPAAVRRVCVLCAGAMAVVLFVVTLFWAQGYHRYLSYIEYALSPLWDDRMSLLGHISFYTPFGHAVHRIWGWTFWVGVGLFLWVAVPICTARKQDREFGRLAGIATVVIVLFIPLLFTKDHNIAFGSFFYAAVLALIFFCLRMVCSGISNRAKVALFIVLLAVSASQTQLIWRSPLSPPERRASVEAFDAMLKEITRAPGHKAQTVAFLYDNVTMPHPNLGNLAWLKYGKKLRVTRFDDFSDMELLNSILNSSRWIVATDNTEGRGLNKQFSATRHAKELYEMVQQDPRFIPVLNRTVDGIHMTLFQKQML